MMSFWNSRYIKAARKEHRCEFCGKVIAVGGSYHRESGVVCGELNDYCLCDRCKYIVDGWEDPDTDELGCLLDYLIGTDLLTCDECGETQPVNPHISADRMTVYCECGKCKEDYEVDVSIEGIKEIYSRW